MKSRTRQILEIVGSILFIVIALVAAVFATALGVIEPKMELAVDSWSTIELPDRTSGGNDADETADDTTSGDTDDRDTDDGEEEASDADADDGFDGIIVGTFTVTNTGGINLELTEFGPATAQGWRQLTASDSIGPVTIGPNESASIEVRFEVDCDTIGDVRWDPDLTVGGFIPLNKTASFDLGREPVPGFAAGDVEGRGDDNPLLQEWHLGPARQQVCAELN